MIKGAEQGFGESEALNDRLRQALDEITPHGNLGSVSLGRQLAYRKDRIVDGMRIEEAGKRDGTKLWRVVCDQGERS